MAKYQTLLMGSTLLLACEEPFEHEICNSSHFIESQQEQRERLGDTSCNELIPGHNKRDEDRINVIFVGVNYDTVETIAFNSMGCNEDYGLLANPIIGSNTDSFNFWYANETIETTIAQGWDQKGREPTQKAQEIAKACELPRKSLIILENAFFRSNATFGDFQDIGVQSIPTASLQEIQMIYEYLTHDECTAKMNYCFLDSPSRGSDPDLCNDFSDLQQFQPSITPEAFCRLATRNTTFGTMYIEKDGVRHLAHEAYHSLSALDDEYFDAQSLDRRTKKSEESYISRIWEKSKNCYPAATKKMCETLAPWVTSGVSPHCYQGCGYANEVAGLPLWRSEENGTLRTNKTLNPGEWNGYVLCKTIDAVTQKASGECDYYLSLANK